MNQRAAPHVRNLTVDDIPTAMRLSTDTGWNQTEDDWRMLIHLAPQGCLGIEMDGELASTATLLCYGKQLAWLGMVLTGTSYRGRGFARRLVTEALALADRSGIQSVKLDATDQGRSLYEKLGFRPEQGSERWERAAGTVTPIRESISLTPTDEDWLWADIRAFGADRSELLRRLAHCNPALVLGSSYLLTRPGRTTQYLGPCVAERPSTARILIERALHSASTSGWSWDLVVANSSATHLARNLGFTPKRHLTRMVRGRDLRGEDTSIYAIAGFELG